MYPVELLRALGADRMTRFDREHQCQPGLHLYEGVG